MILAVYLLAVLTESMDLSVIQASGSVDTENMLVAAAVGILHDITCHMKNGATTYDRDTQNRTPLQYAVAKGNLETIGLLLKFKKANWRANDGITPLHLAASPVERLLRLWFHE